MPPNVNQPITPSLYHHYVQDITTISPLYHHYIAIKPYQNGPEYRCLNPSASFVLIAFCLFYHDLGPGPFADSPDHRHPWTWLPVFSARFTQLRKWPKIWGMMWNNGGFIIKHDDLMEFDGISCGYPLEHPKLWPVEWEKLGIAAPNLWPVEWEDDIPWNFGCPTFRQSWGFKEIQFLMSKKQINFLPIENGAPEHECSSNRFNIFP